MNSHDIEIDKEEHSTYICKQEAAERIMFLLMMEPAQRNSPVMWKLAANGKRLIFVLFPLKIRLVSLSSLELSGPIEI